MIVGGVLALSLFFFMPHAQAIGEETWDCYKNDTQKIDSYDVWSRYIEISIPIPGVTDKLYCYEAGTKATPKASYYYTESLGDYLSKFYQYFVSIVGILGAVMVMYGGIRWILAAGNQQRIQGAKNVIFSAIVGIVIAFCSYLLLFLLNPRLVDYSTLQTHLVNIAAVAQSTEYCVDFERLDNQEGDFQYYPLSGAGAAVLTKQPQNIECNVEAAILDPSTVAGIVAGNPNLSGTSVATCWGKVCPTGKACVREGFGVYKCTDSFLFGGIEWEGDAYVENMRMVAVCKDGRRFDSIEVDKSGLLSDSIGDKTQYALPGEVDTGAVALRPAEEYSAFNYQMAGARLLHLARKCNDRNYSPLVYNDLFWNYAPEDEAGIAGFYLDIEVNDNDWLLEILTIDDNFAVGRTCLPISKKTPGDIALDEWVAFGQNRQLITLRDFLSVDAGKWKTTGAFECNLTINRSVFPSR